jgi:hypothetical protein
MFPLKLFNFVRTLDIVRNPPKKKDYRFASLLSWTQTVTSFLAQTIPTILPSLLHPQKTKQGREK